MHQTSLQPSLSVCSNLLTVPPSVVPCLILCEVFLSRQSFPLQVSLCKVVLSTCLHSPCPSVCLCLSSWLFLRQSLEVTEGVSGKVSVVLAADALTGWVLGGLNCDGHHVGGWWEVWVALPWNLSLWHDVVDFCDGEKGEREWVMCRCL